MNKNRHLPFFSRLFIVLLLLVAFVAGGGVSTPAYALSAAPFPSGDESKLTSSPELNIGAFGAQGNDTLLAVRPVASTQSLDPDFDPGANGAVLAMAVQADGKILVGGKFTMLGGGSSGTTMRNYIGRLNADGSLDASFNPGASSWVYALAVQADGKILVGGGFTNLGGTGTTMRSNIGRLNADGSLDTTFDPGANNDVNALVVQVDGKILVGGKFTMLGGGGTGLTTRNCIGRLNANGSLDTGFDPGANGTVSTLAVQTNGKILAGGAFTKLGGGTGTTTRNKIGRINADGTLDTSFDPGANNDVYVMAVQTDGKTLVGGAFTKLGGGSGTTTRYRIGRINTDGTLDTSFDPGASSSVWALAVQTDEKILVSGDFSKLGGGLTGTTARHYIGRLNANGTLDTSFDPGANYSVRVLVMQADGKILVGGYFTTFGGGGEGTMPLYFLGRLNADDSAPIVSTGAATGSGATGATLNGTVNPNGSATTAFFEFGLTMSYGSQTPAQNIGGGTTVTGVSATLTSLTSCTPYHFRAVATNPSGTIRGSDATFLTTGCSMGTIAVSPVSLHFAATKAGASGELTGVTPPVQTMTVTFSGTANPWTASGNQAWLQVNGGAGEAAGAFTVAIANPGNVIGGSTTLTGAITVTAPNAPNSPLSIPVTLTIDHGWGKNYQVGNGTGEGSPVKLASDPQGKLYAMQSRTDFGRYETQFWSSTNLGKTWGPPVSINPADETVMLLPSIAVGSNRAINIAWMGKLDDIDNDIFFTRSTDEGATWSANLDIIPLASRAPNQVSPVIVADPRSGQSNSLYVAMRTYNAGVEHVFTIRSLDGGATWGDLVPVPYPDGTDIYKIDSLNLQIDASGMLYLVFDEYIAGENRIFFSRSSNNGFSWETVKPITPLNDCGVDGLPSLALGNTGVVYVAFVVKNHAHVCGRGDSDQLQLMLTKSLDSGATWVPASRIGPLNLSGYFRDIAAGYEDGNLLLKVIPHQLGLGDDELFVVWNNDNWLDNGLWTAKNSVVRSIQSVDGGAHWDASASLYGEVMLPSDRVNAVDLNHLYPDTVVHQGQVLAVWVDNRVANFIYPFISVLGNASEGPGFSIYLPSVRK